MFYKPTQADVELLSPDAASLKAASKLLSKKSSWSGFGRSHSGADLQAVWGQCKGSGKKPYLTQVDVTNGQELAFKCSCPSRKFPCKHALALLLFLAQDASLFADDNPPEWVVKWLESRAGKQKKSASANEKPVDKEAQAKRLAARESKVMAGLEELEQWLYDLIRVGLASLADKPSNYFETMAARLVDAQAKGLANRVRSLDSYSLSDPQNALQALAELGNLQLIVASYRNKEHLSASVREDVRQVVGWTIRQKELLQQAGVQDTWLVLAQYDVWEDGLQVVKRWLWGKKSRKVGLELNFIVKQMNLVVPLLAGKSLDAELVYFPSNYPQRVVLKKYQVSSDEGIYLAQKMQDITASDMAELANSQAAYATFTNMLKAYSEALAACVWLEDFPAHFPSLTPIYFNEKFTFLDAENKALPLHPDFPEANIWNILAVSGGNPLAVTAVWDGNYLIPVSLWQAQTSTFISLQF